jgi:hypothetical protein
MGTIRWRSSLKRHSPNEIEKEHPTMIARTLAALALLGAAPVAAVPPHGDEVTIPHMSRFLEWRPDGNQALFVRAESGRWYRVTLEAPCPRMLNRSNTHFNASPTDRFDRLSSIRADGWRCQVAHISHSEGPPSRRR